MLGKLMKYELRAGLRVMLPSFVIMLGMAALTRLSVDFLLGQQSLVWRLLGGLLITLFSLAVVGVGVAALVLTILRFRNNLLGDEGYLMHTLPVSIHANIVAKLLANLIWYFAAAAAIVLSVFILTVNVEGLRLIRESFMAVVERLTPGTAANLASFLLEAILLASLALSEFALMIYAALALGQRRHGRRSLRNVLWFLAIYFVRQMVCFFGIVSAVRYVSVDSLPHGGGILITLFGSPSLYLSPAAFTHAALLGACLLFAVFCAILYVITARNLKNRLNLE